MADLRNTHLQRQSPSRGGSSYFNEALGEDEEEAQVLSAPPFVQAHLRKMANIIGQDCVKIQHRPEHLVAQETGMQLGFALLQRTLLSRNLHLLRGQAKERTEELCETLTTQMRQVFRSWLSHPTLNAIHWNLAHLPIVAGGLGLPDLHAFALAACTAALATIPGDEPLRPCGIQSHAPR